MVKSYAEGADKRRSQPESFRFDVGPYVLMSMTLTFLTTNVGATHRLRSKVLEFLELLDERTYADNQDVCWHIALARGVGRSVIKHGARTLPAVEHRVLEDTDWAEYHAAFFESYRNNTGHAAEGYILENELSNDDLNYVESYVSTRLRFSFLWEYRSFFRDVADSIDAGDMGEVSTFSEETLGVLERVVQKGRYARAVLTQESQDFTTGETSFEAAIRAAHAARNKPQSTVKTGIRMLNDMLGGGYEGSRVYIHFGRSGYFHSRPVEQFTVLSSS